MKKIFLYFISFVFGSLVTSAQNYNKMSHSLKQKIKNAVIANQSKGLDRSISRISGEKKTFALIKTTDNIVEDYCISHQGNIHIVYMPLSKIAEISNDERVIRIESEPLKTSISNDSARSVTNTNIAQQGGGVLPQAYDGTGVLVGIEDMSFDYNHPTFLSKKDNQIRIQRVWDMLNGIEEQDYDITSNFPIGKLLKDEEIITQDHSSDSHIQYHGTHTAGTAAGSGYDTSYGGMAPEADLYFVNSIFSNNSELIPEDLQETINSSELTLLGFQNIFNYADSIGEPCVINYSAGEYGDITGEKALFNEFLTSILGPGKIIVASIGNEGENGQIMYKTTEQESVGGKITRFPLTMAISSDKELTFKITDNNKSEYYTYTPVLSTTTTDTIAALDSINILTFCYDDPYNKGRIGYDITIEEKKNASNSNYSISFSGVNTDARIHIQYGKIEGAVLGGSTYCPGEFDSVIGVGATAWRKKYTDITGKERTANYGENGERGSFSSIGPALTGNIKPDVVAPGVNIISANNRTYAEKYPTSQLKEIVAKSTYNDKEYSWIADSGTSMSTPIVTGIIALWLQAKPDLTTEEIKNVIAHTSNQNNSSLTYPNNEYGYGEINAYKGLLYILNLTDVKGLSTQHITNAKVRPTANGNILISLPYSNNTTKVRLYNTSGQCILNTTIPPETTEYTISFNGAKGIYAVQLDNYGSTLIRIE